ncbi:MAG: choline/ethanolamine kinase family protein, partial [Alphaproteobacteria bacterium]|nr:choline/ethanolamine kinase family protein [Alphaproteobacteria bacterium]
MQDGARRRAKELPIWSGPVSPEPLPGGISNTNFTVVDDGRRYVVRVGADAPEHAVWRFNEVTVSRAAHAAGLSPEIRHHEPDVLVMDFIENGQALDEKAVRETDTLARIVALVRRCHAELPRHLEVPGPMFWVFSANRRYARMIEAAGERLSDRLAELMALNDRLEAGVGPIRPVFCHNDLLAANLIDDGERLWLIDWEHAGISSPLFDLANLSSNNGLAASQETWLLET